MITTAYKIVTTHNDSLWSSATSMGLLTAVEYKVGEWTYPHPDLPNSKLFVYLQDGLHVARDLRVASQLLFECEALDATPHDRMRIAHPDVTFPKLKVIWDKNLDVPSTWNYFVPDKEVYLASAVRLVKPLD